MPLVLQLISVVYLFAVWAFAAVAVGDPSIEPATMFLAAIALSLPGLALAFYAKLISGILGARREGADEDHKTDS